MGLIDYGTSSAFTRFLEFATRYGLWKALFALSSVLGLAILAYYLKVKIEMLRTEATGASEERRKMIESREGDHRRLLEEVTKAREQNYIFTTNHLEHDRQEREQLGITMSQQLSTLRAISEEIKTHRQEEAVRSSKTYEMLQDVRVGLAGIKTA